MRPSTPTARIAHRSLLSSVGFACRPPRSPSRAAAASRSISTATPPRIGPCRPTTPSRRPSPRAATRRARRPSSTSAGARRASTVQIFRAGAGAPTGRLQGDVRSPAAQRCATVRAAARLDCSATGRAASTTPSVTTPGRGVWYAPFVLRPGGSARARRSSSCRRTHGRPTTSRTATRGTRTRASTRSTSTGRSSTAASRRTTTATTAASSAGSPQPARRPTSSPTTTSTQLERRRRCARYDLDRLLRARGVRHGARVRPDQRYRDLGGNLAFLSANNFFYKVVKHGEQDGRPHGAGATSAGPRPRSSARSTSTGTTTAIRTARIIVTDVAAAPWLFAGTGLHDGDAFGIYGIEVDERDVRLAAAAPHVLAGSPTTSAPARRAEMTYYTDAGRREGVLGRRHELRRLARSGPSCHAASPTSGRG